MVRTGDQAVERVSRQIAPYGTQQYELAKKILCRPYTPAEILKNKTHLLTVWLLTLGCQILVSNFIVGGRKGYSAGSLISIWNVPPSYGVLGGPGKEPFKCVRSSPPPAGATVIWDS